LLFIHGFLTSSHLWARVVPLVPPGHRVVVPDLLGFGRSDPPTGHGAETDLTIAGHVRRLTELLDVLGIDQVCIVGHGMGAAIAIAMQHANPRRVTRLGLTNPVLALTPSALTSGLLRATLPILGALPGDALLGILRRRLLRAYQDSADHKPAADLYLRPFHGAAGRVTLGEHLRDLTASDRPASWDEHTPLTAAPGPPTALVCGDRDPLLSIAAAKQIQLRLPNSTLEVVGGGHFSPEESPEQLAEVIKGLLSRS
jgi:pimeloyl-ACP methyl ester carboxylesterase